MTLKKNETKADKSRKKNASPKKKEIGKSASTYNKKKDFYIVGIGASAGGLEAYERFFRNMPDDSGMAYVLVPHLDPKHVSLMPELIQKCSKMPVFQVNEGIKIQPNTIYIVPPNRELAMLNRQLQPMEVIEARGLQLPINAFFRSLATDQKDMAIGIIMSGMGTDGTLGLQAIKIEMGMTMVQSPESAKYDSMPISAINTEVIDFILPPEKMPEQLIAYIKHSVVEGVPNLALLNGMAPDALQKIFILLRNHTGHDFSGYKQNTICRRIERRMNVHQINIISDYVRYLRENIIEIETLFKELLIGVTNFFRDKEAFTVMKDMVLPGLLKERSIDDVIRVWVPGCSSGEEAYSIAITLRECAETLKLHFRIQVFATDIDESSIEAARSGIYPGNIAADMDAERLKLFFTEEDNMYRIKKDIREMLVFAKQDIIKDPPFTKLDMVCCRNLLIYMGTELQKKLFPLFHYSLKSGGILFLGSSETIGGFTDLFSPIDKKWKIFKRAPFDASAHADMKFSPIQSIDVANGEADKKLTGYPVIHLAVRSLLEKYAPPSVIINNNGDILYIHGRTGKYLEPAPGEAKMNVYTMAREGLKMELSACIRKATTRREEVTLKQLPVKTNGNIQKIDLTVKPIITQSQQTDLLIIVFEDIKFEKDTFKSSQKQPQKKKTNDNVKTLERELHITQENLQTTIEELETSNEELKSTNEELQSTNEELQSTNEELETSKEEQQSMNEELTMVNAELQEKINELTISNNDMKNLIDSIDIPTIFLNNDLRIKRFTANATRVINLILSDVGRPISDIATRLTNMFVDM